MAGNSTADYVVKQGDTANTLNAALTYNDGTAVNLTGATVKFVMRAYTAANPAINAAATIVTPAAGTVSYTFTAADTATAGTYEAVFQVTFSGGTTQTFPTDGTLEIWVEENAATSTTPRLVGLAEVKDYLRITATSREYDNRLLAMIDAAAPVIEAITGPVLQRRVQNETYDGGSWFIELRNRPVINVEQVVEYRGPIPYNLTQVPTPDLGQIYSYMYEPPGRLVRRTVGGGITPFPPGADQVFVTYTAGYLTVPTNIREATLELIRENFVATQTPGGPRTGAEALMGPMSDTTPAMVGAMVVPPRVREWLMPHKLAPRVA